LSDCFNVTGMHLSANGLAAAGGAMRTLFVFELGHQLGGIDVHALHAADDVRPFLIEKALALVAQQPGARRSARTGA
jgi:hypothetical protein